MLLLGWIGCSIAGEESTAVPQQGAAPAKSGEQQKAPSLQIAEKTFDFGEVMEGGEVSHDFAIKNTGAETLEIAQVRPG